MTPPEHLFIGISLGNIIYSLQSLGKKIRVSYLIVILLSGLFAIFPDIDSFFGSYTSENIFIAHRGITHSILFILLVSIAFCFLCFLFIYLSKIFFPYKKFIKYKIVLLILFLLSFLAGLSHLLCDLPQPAGAWGGIPFFFPLLSNGEYLRIGGWAKVGWYDYLIQRNYFFLFVISLFLIISSVLLRKLNYKKSMNFISVIIILLNISLYIWTFNYINKSEYINESNWQKIQNRHLENFGEPIKSLTLKGKNYFLNVFFKIK